MTILAATMVALIALLHFYFLLLEMFFWINLWDAYLQYKPEFAKASRTLRRIKVSTTDFLQQASSGTKPGHERDAINIFFLICVIVAGVFGGLTASRRIFLSRLFLQ